MIDEQKRGAFASLSSRFKKEKSLHVRPPYNEDNSLFHKSCPTCEDTPCVTICEEEIIKLDDDKVPYISFDESGCTFCQECAKACPNEVLVLGEVVVNQINAKVSIDIGTCLAWSDVMCSSCLDSCDERAIEFLGVFRPTVNMNKCTACGFCYGVCPVYSVKFKGI